MRKKGALKNLLVQKGDPKTTRHMLEPYFVYCLFAFVLFCVCVCSFVFVFFVLFVCFFTSKSDLNFQNSSSYSREKVCVWTSGSYFICRPADLISFFGKLIFKLMDISDSEAVCNPNKQAMA